MSGWILAVDFGTVNTGAAIRFADGRVEKVKLDPNSDTMPSAVVVTEGRWRVGQAALNARRTHPDTFIGSPKARLGQEPLVLGEDLVSPAQIASHVLAAVRERAVRAAGGTDPDRLVLTHPVRWGRARLTALQEAAQIAGFSPEAIRLLPEPIAALHAHVQPGSLPPGSRVAVVDTGGGTCDVAVLQTTDDPAPGKDLLVVAQEGDDRLGGNDLDDLLYQWVLAQLTTAGRTDMVTALADPEHLGAALTLLDVVRSAKQDLSEHTNAPVAVAVAGQETTLTVTREEYEDLIAEPMTRAGALTTRALTASGTTHLAGLYLTGGTAYTPALSRAVHQVTGILTSPLGDPKLAVAVGALKTPVAVMSAAELAALTQQLRQRRPQHQPTPTQVPPSTLAPLAQASPPPSPAPAPPHQVSGLPHAAPASTAPHAPSPGYAGPSRAPAPTRPQGQPTRKPRRVGVVVAVVAALLVVGAGITTAVVLANRSHKTPIATTTGTGPASTPPTTDAPSLTDADLTQLCQSRIGATGATGSTTLDHQAWGSAVVVACGPTHSTGPDEHAGVLAIDDSGRVRWAQLFTAGYTDFAMASPATDASGNIFLTYNPGRYDGVIVLHPTSTGMQVLVGGYDGDGAPATSLSFYDAQLQSPASPSGLYQVTVTTSDCNPSCASGTTTSKVYTWNGTAYVATG